jgi:hypothetical protein
MRETTVVAVQQDLWDEINAEIKFNFAELRTKPGISVAEVAFEVHRAMDDVGRRHGLEVR